MTKKIFLILVFIINLYAHPVSYTIDLTATYDEVKKEVLIICKSDSRNKCGLHNIDLLDENETLIAKANYPFLKNKKVIPLSKKPKIMVFYLRNIPEHKYIVHLK